MNTNLLNKPNLKPSKEQTLVQLWHGVPLKHIGHDVKYTKIKESDFNLILDHELVVTDYILIPNDFCEPIFKTAFRLKQEINLLKFGYPRNDYYFKNNFTLNKDIFGPHKNKKIVYYAPTWNDEDIWSTFKFVKHFDKLVEETKDTHFYILSFHTGTKNIFNFHPKTSNWMINENNVISNIELFHLSDCLITDFSSIMFDFAITNKPVINLFTKHHYEEYKKHRGIYFDLYEEGFNIANNVTQLKILLNNLESLDNKISKYAPIKEYAAKDILEKLKITKAYFVHEVNEIDTQEINIKFSNKEYLQNEIIFKIKFATKRLLLKLRRK